MKKNYMVQPGFTGRKSRYFSTKPEAVQAWMEEKRGEVLQPRLFCTINHHTVGWMEMQMDKGHLSYDY